ncbi:hypothetical protein MKZ38_004692 [Zalerion maritima]|uniref:Pre-mRNA-processing factor 19 n=1 Tax=Zalerion maritima TaxID=339359 RepID=A0AAD5RKZ0_9PEZI|nr:hypothetical protein MKZ38_004692 [Zalerion maritima]
MLCAISGEAPQEPVASRKNGTVYEKRLVEKYIEENGKDPVTGEELSIDDLLPLKTERIVAPRPPTLTSIPALLATFQNEWDAVALERYSLKEQLARTREELATALYQLDGATRVIERLSRERDEARDALSKVTVSVGISNGEAMAVDNEGLPEALVAAVEETQAKLSKSRKKRPIPEGWVTSDEVSSFKPSSTDSLPVPQTSSAAVQGAYAAIGGLEGDVAIFSLEAGAMERTIKVDEPVTDTLWADSGKVLFFATSKGSVKRFDGGSEVASFSEHAGPATAISMHPSGQILASVGSDKSIVFYNIADMSRASRVYTNSSITTGVFHPDGHFFAAGTTSGDIKLLMTVNGEEAASFSLGAPVRALAFSENGFFFAATAKGQSSVTVFDLRKEGEAAKVKVLDIGGAVESLAWDYSGQFLATAGPSGVTVQQYTKSAKSWSEPLRTAVVSACVRWCPLAKKLLAVSSDGVVSVLAAGE